jgi:hypothetical protein
MTRRTFATLTLVAAGAGLLAGCGGASTPAEVAAQACEAQVREQTNGKPFKLDLALLASSATDAGGGTQLLTVPVVVNAGLAEESTQQLECTVRMAADATSAEVLNLRFIW